LKVHYDVYNCPPLDSMLSQMKPVHTHPPSPKSVLLSSHVHRAYFMPSYPSLPVNFLCLRFTSPQRMVLKHLFNVTDQALHPYKTVGKIIVLNVFITVFLDSILKKALVNTVMNFQVS
jgi:hypothetical protein